MAPTVRPMRSPRPTSPISKKILDAAHAQNQGVVISLWSFGMLDSAQASNTTVLANNKLLLTNATNRQAYITNWLTPMVTALKGYPGLFA